MRNYLLGPVLDRDAEVRVIASAAAGDREAREQLFDTGARLALKLAARYYRHAETLGFEPDDVDVAALQGIWEATSRVEPGHSARFGTFATFHARAAIQVMLRNGSESGVRVPTNQRIGTPNAEAAAAMQPSIALDAPMGPDDDSPTLGDVLQDDRATEPDVDGDELEQLLDAALGTLDDRSATIVRAYFALGDDDPQSLEEIAPLVGISRERTRQVRNEALRELRRCPTATVPLG